MDATGLDELASDILLTLSLAFDNLVEANNAGPQGPESTERASLWTNASSSDSNVPGSAITIPPLPLPPSSNSSSPKQPERRFQRPGRQRRSFSSTVSNAAGSSSLRSSSRSSSPCDMAIDEAFEEPGTKSCMRKRVRSLDTDMESTETSAADGAVSVLKRARSIMKLSNELESLQVSSASPRARSAKDFSWLGSFLLSSEDCGGLLPSAQVSLESVMDYDRGNDVDVFAVLRQMRGVAAFGETGPKDFSAWFKWRVLVRFEEEVLLSVPSSIRAILNRQVPLLTSALERVADGCLDWNDPDLIFILLRLISALHKQPLHTTAATTNPSLGYHRKLEEYTALYRGLMQLCRLVHDHASRELLGFLKRKAEASALMAELMETGLEMVLNVFETVTCGNQSAAGDAMDINLGIVVASVQAKMVELFISDPAVSSRLVEHMKCFASYPRAVL
jgi:hypothetical protein